MSRLGAAGWSAIGRRYGVIVFWLFILAIVTLLLGFIYFVLHTLGLLAPVQKLLEWAIYILGIVLVIGFFGTAGVLGWNFIKDLGHNAYAKWKAGGVGTAARGLVADIKACGGGLINGLRNKVKEYGGSLIAGLRRMFGR